MNFERASHANAAWRRSIWAGALATAIALAAPAVRATESGATEFPIGVDTVMAAMNPEVGGTLLLNYSQYYGSSSNNGNDGHKNAAYPNFKLNVEVDAPKLLHTWGEFHGVDITSGIVQPIVNSNITILDAVAKGHDTGLGDTNLLPLILSGDVGGGLHLATSSNLWVPDGYYNANDPASTGLNRTTFGQEFSTTWFISPKWTTSTATMIEFGSKNPATHYYSGSYVNTDFSVNYSGFEPLPKLTIGLQGYYMRQFESDRQNGQIVDGTGYKGMALALGPQFIYEAWSHGAIVVKFQHEIAAENRAQGDKVWLQLAVPLGD